MDLSYHLHHDKVMVHRPTPLGLTALKPEEVWTGAMRRYLSKIHSLQQKVRLEVTEAARQFFAEQRHKLTKIAFTKKAARQVFADQK